MTGFGGGGLFRPDRDASPYSTGGLPGSSSWARIYPSGCRPDARSGEEAVRRPISAGATWSSKLAWSTLLLDTPSYSGTNVGVAAGVPTGAPPIVTPAAGTDPASIGAELSTWGPAGGTLSQAAAGFLYFAKPPEGKSVWSFRRKPVSSVRVCSCGRVGLEGMKSGPHVRQGQSPQAAY